MGTLLNRRRYMGGGGGRLTPNDYIQNGLVSMFDGEWNSGVNLHSNSPSVWIDLVSNNDLNIMTSNVNVGDNYFQNTSYSSCIAYKNGIIPCGTQEIVMQVDDYDPAKSAFVIANNVISYRGNFHWSYNIFSALMTGSLDRETRSYFNYPITDRGIHTCSASGLTESPVATCMMDGALQTGSRTTIGRNGSAGYFVLGGLDPEQKIYGTKCKIFCVRLYNRDLSTDEMLFNQHIDNIRFNLGLSI